MRWFWIFIFVGVITGCSVPGSEDSARYDQADSVKPLDPAQLPKARAVNLEDLGPAAELENKIWLNVERPLRLADLKGKVILLDMWTFG